MAKRTVVTFVDDLDGSEAAGTIVFAIAGTTYEIDLSDANAGKLRALLAPFVEKARKAGAKVKAPRAPRRPSALRQRAAEIAAQPAETSNLSPEEWGELAPKDSDPNHIATEKLKVWCRAMGLNVRGRGGSGRYLSSYKDFYKRQAWSVPKDSDLSTEMSKAMSKAAKSATVLEFQAPGSKAS